MKHDKVCCLIQFFLLCVAETLSLSGLQRSADHCSPSTARLYSSAFLKLSFRNLLEISHRRVSLDWSRSGISDPRSVGSCYIKEADESVTKVPFNAHDPSESKNHLSLSRSPQRKAPYNLILFCLESDLTLFVTLFLLLQ